MFGQLKKMIKGEKNSFNKLCNTNNIQLDYHSNKNEIHILRSIFEEREYSDFFPFYKNVTILDIGAHYGYFSVFASKNTGTGSKIFAVEPNKNNHSQLQKNISKNKLNNIQPSNIAIGGQIGKAKLFTGNNPNHSLFADYKLLDSNGKHEEVNVTTLEQFIIENNLKHIDFLKMDCEGAEYAIFESTPDFVFEKITTISMEFHDMKNEKQTAEALIQKLLKNNFNIVKYAYDKTERNLNYGKIIATKLFS